MESDAATVLNLRRDLALQIARCIEASGMSQSAMADWLGIPQPTLSRIVRQRVDAASLELLIRVAVRAGLPVVLQVGREPGEAGVYAGRAAAVSARSAGRTQTSALGERAQAEMTQAALALSPTQRLEAQLRHSELLAQLRAPQRITDASPAVAAVAHEHEGASSRSISPAVAGRRRAARSEQSRLRRHRRSRCGCARLGSRHHRCRCACFGIAQHVRIAAGRYPARHWER
jgi:predicted XRE-type DNA-binding protein